MTSSIAAFVDVRGMPVNDAAILVHALAPQVESLALRTDDETVALAEQFSDADTWQIPATGHVLVVVAAPVVCAQGALARLLDRAGVAGRVVTRVYVLGGGQAQMIALWSTEWLVSHNIRGTMVAELDLTFDSEHLPHDDPQVRGWVPADELGIAPIADIGADVDEWARSVARREMNSAWLAGARSRLGSLRRRLRLYRQRREFRRRTDEGTGARG